MKINEMVKEVHEYAKSKGWWESPRTPLEIHMLVVSEIAEASEEVRNNRPAVYVHNVDGGVAPVESIHFTSFERIDRSKEGVEYVTPIKPEGEAIELADAVIRIMDYFGKKGWDLEAAIRAKHNYNLTRPYRHGGKSI